MTTRRPIVAYPDGADSARVAPDEVAALTGLSGHPEVILGWMPDPAPWIESPTLRGVTFMAGYGLRGAVEQGRLRYLPVRLGSVPRALGVLRPDVAVVSGVRRGSRLAYRGTVGWAPAAVAAAEQVVVEVHVDAVDLGTPLIEGVVDHVIDVDGHRPPPATSTPEAADEAIGRNVVRLFPPEPSVQLGPGNIAEAIVAAIDRPVLIRSGLVSESMAALADRGLLRGVAVGGYPWGGEALERLAAQGLLTLSPVERTHDVGALAATPRFVACNTALQVGLDGSVNVERVGGRLVAGIGGHGDFCAGASRSRDGLSIIALRSTTRSGASTIVASVESVSTPRSDVDVIVTEHGVADLRGMDDARRAQRLVSIAAPEHRDELGSNLPG